MSLDVAEFARCDIGAVQGFLDHRRLRLGVRHGVAFGGAAMIDRRAFDCCVNPVAVCLGLPKRLQNKRRDTFTRYKAVRLVAKTVALTFCDSMLDAQSCT